MRVIAGTARGQVLLAPSGRSTRPTGDRVKEALFNMVAALVPGAAVLDLYAGTGALGIEALSRGAASAVFVDNEAASARLIRRNLEKTRLATAAEIRCADAVSACGRLLAEGRRFHLILVDPPYRGVEAGRALAAVDSLLVPGGTVAVEQAAREELPPVAGNLSLVRLRSYGDTRLAILRSGG